MPRPTLPPTALPTPLFASPSRQTSHPPLLICIYFLPILHRARHPACPPMLVSDIFILPLASIHSPSRLLPTSRKKKSIPCPLSLPLAFPSSPLRCFLSRAPASQPLVAKEGCHFLSRALRQVNDCSTPFFSFFFPFFLFPFAPPWIGIHIAPLLPAFLLPFPLFFPADFLLFKTKSFCVLRRRTGERKGTKPFPLAAVFPCPSFLFVFAPSFATHLHLPPRHHCSPI